MGEGIDELCWNIVIQSVRFVLKMNSLEILLGLIVQYLAPRKI